MSIVYLIAYYYKGLEYIEESVLLHVSGLVAYIFSMLVLDQIIKRNELSQLNTYAAFFYATLSALFPEALTQPFVLWSNLLVLLALQQVLKLRNEKRVKSKLLNASLYIALASLFHFWSISFLSILFLGIILFQPYDYRNWLVPGVGIFAIIILTNFFTLLFQDSFFNIFSFAKPISFDFESYLGKKQLLSVILCVIWLLYFCGIYVLRFRRRIAKTRPISRLLVGYLVICCFMIIVVHKTTAELIFVTTPIAIMGVSYLEKYSENLSKEIHLWVLALAPIINFLI